MAMKLEGSVYSAVVTLEANCEFKIAGKGWAPQFCFGDDNDVFSTTNLSQTLVANGGNMVASDLEGQFTATFNYDTMVLTFADAAGVEGIDAEQAAPVYYNLQGVRIDNPENGLFIVKKGNKVSKVIR